MERVRSTATDYFRDDRLELSPLAWPDNFGYVAVFLTLACNLRCSYCLNTFGFDHGNLFDEHAVLPGEDWIRGLNRLVLPPDLPVTLEGGEPSLHPDFYKIINGLKPELNIDLLTNLQFDVAQFMKEVSPERLRRKAPYASIRVSYHPETMDLPTMMKKVLTLIDHGFSVGVWAIDHPANQRTIRQAQAECIKAGIDFRTKEFLGYHQGKLHGRYKYPDSVGSEKYRSVHCLVRELTIGPTGDVYRCHSDLYNRRSPIGHLCDEDFMINRKLKACPNFGTCNPCDVKVKTNRFEKDGYTSAKIRF